MAFLPEALGNVEYFWDDPRKVGSLVQNPDGTSYYRGPGTGTSSFITHSRLRSRDFIKGNDVIFLLSLEGKFGANGKENSQPLLLLKFTNYNPVRTYTSTHITQSIIVFIYLLFFLVRCDWTFGDSACTGTTACYLSGCKWLFKKKKNNNPWPFLVLIMVISLQKCSSWLNWYWKIVLASNGYAFNPTKSGVQVLQLNRT